MDNCWGAKAVKTDMILLMGSRDQSVQVQPRHAGTFLIGDK